MMVSAFFISSKTNLIARTLSCLPEKRRDYSSYIVVFPGKRPSHFIRKALAGRERQSVIPPRIFSMDEFVDFVCEGVLKVVTRKIGAIDSVAFLYDIHREIDNSFGGDHFMTADSFIPLGMKMFGDLEELCIEGIAPGSVKGIEHMALDFQPEQSLQNLRSLASFYDSFYKRLSAGNCSTRSSRYRIVSENIHECDLTGYDKIIFAGFFALTGAEKKIFKGLMDIDNTLFLFQQGRGIERMLKELALSPVREKDDTDSAAPEIKFIKSPDTHGQTLALSKILVDDMKESILYDERTLIMIPSSDTLFPLVHQSLSLLGKENYNISIGYPLYRTPVYSFLNHLMELIVSMEGGRIYLPDYLKFVLHPYTKNIFYNGNASITRIVFHTIEEILLETRTKTFLTLEDIEEDNTILDAIFTRLRGVREFKRVVSSREALKKHLTDIHSGTIRKFLKFKDISDFAVKGIEVLSFIYDHSTAPLHPYFHPFTENFIKSLHTLSKSLVGDISFNERRGYFNLARRYLMTCHTPFEGLPVRGVQVLGFLETRNLSFDRVFILDSNEGVLPAVRKEDTLIPLMARNYLGLPDYSQMESVTEYYLGNLIEGAKEVRLFFIEKDKKEKSRFIEKMIWARQKKEGERDETGYIQTIEYSVSLTRETPKPVGKSNHVVKFLREFKFSASSLDTYLRCPLHFYYRYVLNIQEKAELTGDIEVSEIGSFVHDVLKNYFEEYVNRGLLTIGDISNNRLMVVTDSLFKETYGDDVTGAAWLLKHQIKTHLKEFFQFYQRPLVKDLDVEIKGIEERIEVKAGHGKNDFHLKGFLDRVETRNGRLVIVDYKTSADKKKYSIDFKKLSLNDRDTWEKCVKTLQLPFYMLLYSKKYKKDVKDIDAMFLLTGQSAISREIEHSFSPAILEISERYDIMEEIIFKLLEEIIDVDKEFEPTVNRKVNCKYCEFINVCGQ